MAKRKDMEGLLLKLTQAFNDADTQKQQYALKHQEAWDYYQGNLPAKVFEWDCRAVPVLAMATDAIVPELINMFCSDENSAVRVVDAEGQMPALVAQALTDIINKVAMSDNSVKKFYNDLFLEAMVFGDCYVKISREDKIKHEYSKTFEDVEEHILEGVLQQLYSLGYQDEHITINMDKSDTVAIKKSEREAIAQATGVPLSAVPKKKTLLTGSIDARLREKNIKIDMLPFEEVFVPSRIRGAIEDARYFCHKITTTRNEALAMGYTLKSVEDAIADNDEDPQSFNTGRLEIGHRNYNDYDTNSSGFEYDCEQVVLLEHYWRGVFDNKYEHLYKITTSKDCKDFMYKYDEETGKSKVDIEQIDYIPIVNGKCMTMPGQFYGVSMFDKLAPLQDLKTRIQRAILTTGERAANPSFTMIKGSVDRRSLLEAGRPGAVVEMQQPNAVGLFPYVDAPNAIYNMNEGVDQQIEAITRGSAGKTDYTEQLAGMSGNAISLLLNNDSTSTMSLAYVLGETLFKPMFKIIMNMLQEHNHPLVIAGEAFDINMIKTDLNFVLDVSTLTDKATQASNLMNFLSTAIQQNGGQLPENITQDNVVNIYQDYLQVALDTRNTDEWITPTEDLPKPSPQQQKVKEAMAIAVLKERLAATQLAEAKVSDMKADTEGKLAKAAQSYAEMKRTMEQIDIDKMNAVVDIKAKTASIINTNADTTSKRANVLYDGVETAIDISEATEATLVVV